MTEINLGTTADMHVHLRDGAMCKLITPTVHSGGISICYVMPNLVPPVTTKEQVESYHAQLQSLSPDTTFLMSLYLCKELTPELLESCKDIIHGIKCYPAGVTTNSKFGVDPNDFSSFYPIFSKMQELGLVLNLHGEKPGGGEDGDGDDINVINAEPKFLPALRKLHADFPKLKIILEHCTTHEAIDLVRELNLTKNSSNGETSDEITIAATITAHHLYLIIDNWAGNPINFCKPVAKFQKDRRALVDAATSGEPWFFFGSDSAPHPIHKKQVHVGVCAGVYTQSNTVGYVAEIFDKQGKLENLKKFIGENGIKFYGLKKEILDKHAHESCWLVERKNQVPEVIGNGDVDVVPFKAGEELKYAVEWRKN